MGVFCEVFTKFGVLPTEQYERPLKELLKTRFVAPPFILHSILMFSFRRESVLQEFPVVLKHANLPPERLEYWSVEWLTKLSHRSILLSDVYKHLASIAILLAVYNQL